MKRNIILSLAFGLAGCFSVFAEGEDKPIYDETNNVGYDTFDAAFKAIESNSEATWIITGEVDVADRYMLENHAHITIKGKDASAKLINKTTNGGHFMLGMKNGGSQWIFENITIDGNNIRRAKPLLEANDGALILKDVKIENYESTSESDGLILIKTAGWGEFENVTVENCSGSYSYITVQKDGFTFAGVNTFSIYVSDGLTVDGSGLKDGNAITITMANPVLESVIVENCTHPEYFIFNHEGYELQVKDGNLIVADDIAVEIPTQVTIEGRAGGYRFLEDALMAASENDVILVNENQVIEDYINDPDSGTPQGNHRVVFSKSITIKGGKDDIEIESRFDNQPFLFNSGAHVILENIAFNGGAAEGMNLFGIEGNAEVTLKNVILRDHTFGKNNNDNKLIHLKNNCKIHLDGVTVENIGGPEDVGMVNINSDGSTFKGVNNISIHLNGKTTIEYVGGTATRAAEPMKIYIDQHEVGDPIVTGPADANSFNIMGKDNVKLVSKDGKLVLAEDTGTAVSEISVDENAPVEYFNLQGVKVTGDLTPGIYVRRQGANTSKVLVK